MRSLTVGAGQLWHAMGVVEPTWFAAVDSGVRLPLNRAKHRPEPGCDDCRRQTHYSATLCWWNCCRSWIKAGCFARASPTEP